MSNEIQDLKATLKSNKVIFGTDQALKCLKLGKLKKVFCASNCNENIKKDIIKYCSMNDVELVEIPNTNRELGVMAKKPFSVSVISVLN